MELRDELRGALADLVGAERGQVALTSSTTDACGIVLRGLALAPGDEIVTTTDEHFGLLGPLGASPAEVVVAAPEPDAILAAVTPRTRLIATSQVLWTTGATLPLAELRAATGVPVLADGAQSVGAVATTVDGLDFLTISGQKWLCGPDSTGALVIADPERLRLVSPSFLAQRRHEPDGTYEPTRGRGGSSPAGGRRGPCGRCSPRSSSGRHGGTSAPSPPRSAAVSCSGRSSSWSSPRRPRRSSRSASRTARRGRRAASRGGRPRPRDPRPRPRPRLVRLVDERRGPRAPRRSAALAHQRESAASGSRPLDPA